MHLEFPTHAGAGLGAGSVIISVRDESQALKPKALASLSKNSALLSDFSTSC